MYRLLRVAYVLVALGFMAFVITREWDKLRILEWHYRVDLLLFSIVLAAIMYALNGYGWHLILKALGYELPAYRSVYVWIFASLARYVPGGVWSLASRVALAKAEGVGVAEATVSLYIEALLLLAASLAVGAAALISAAGFPLSLPAAIVMLGGFAFLLHPKVVALTRLIPGRIGKAFSQVSIPAPLPMLRLYGCYLFVFVLYALAFVFFVDSVSPLPLQNWVLVGASMPLAFFAGFIIVFAPGGIGVRESALYLLLSPYLSGPEALLISVGSRLWFMAAEAVTVGVCALYARAAPRSPGN
ncbi:MAG: lysylphosphatidylglycerol synthase domain-containing protein [Sulfurifustis sp.]